MSSDINEKYNWLNEEFFANVISNTNNSELSTRIKAVKLSSATKVGDNYLSTVLRAEIKVEEKDGYIKSLFFVVKIQEGGYISNELITKFNCFEKEFDIYGSYTKSFEKLHDDLLKFAPRCYHTANSPSKLLVLEDLTQLDYTMHDGILGFSLDISTIVMKKIACFHAASAVFREQNGSKSFNEYFRTGTFNKHVQKDMDHFFNAMYDYYLEGIKNYENYDKYYNIIKKWDKQIYPAMCDLLKYDANEFNVLNHGDLWINNILVQKKTNDVLFVDFQMAFWGTPAFDILYFIMLSCNADTRIEKFDHLIEVYHSKLCEVLTTLRYEKSPPTLQQLQTDINKRGFLFAGLTIDGLSGILYNREEITNLDAFYSAELGDEVLKKSLFSNPLYIDVMKKLLPFMYKRGFLHINEQFECLQ